MIMEVKADLMIMRSGFFFFNKIVYVNFENTIVIYLLLLFQLLFCFSHCLHPIL